MLDVICPLTDLMAGTSEEEDQGIDLQVVEDAVHSTLRLSWEMQQRSFQYTEGRRSSRNIMKI